MTPKSPLHDGFLPPRRRRNAPTLALALALLSASAAGASAGDWDMRLTGTEGFSYFNGSYDTDRNTNVEMSLTTLSLETDDVKLSVALPYMRISGRGLVAFDAAGNPILINRRSTITPTVRSGFSDINISATYTIPPAVLDDFDVRITARLKAPTAPTRRRLSTGLTDFGMNLDVSKTFGDWVPFANVGYLLPGKPAGFDLYNTVSASVGTGLQLSDRLVAIASYDFDSQSSPLVRSSQELFGSLSWIMSDSLTLTGYGTKGLSSGSPDIGLGFLVSYGLN